MATIKAVAAVLAVSLACASARPLPAPQGADRQLLAAEGTKGARSYVDLPAGYNCHGKNINDNPIKGVESFRDCKELCDGDAECFAVSYSSETEKCYLKSSCDKAEEKDDFLSAVVPPALYVAVPDGYNCKVDHNVEGPINDIESLEACLQECDANALCSAITYNNKKNKCYLKASCDEYEEKEDNYSAVRSGSNFVDMPEGFNCKVDHNLEGPITGISSLGACKDLCDANSQCVAMTYNTDTNKCYLKPDCDEFEAKDNNQAAVKAPAEYVQLPADYNCHGKNIADEPIKGVDSLSDCMDLCDYEAECFAVSYNSDTEKCHLKSACDKMEEKDDVISAVKN